MDEGVICCFNEERMATRCRYGTGKSEEMKKQNKLFPFGFQ
jgi:hypothetical protein